MSKVTRDLKSYPYPINRVRGIVPTFSTFDTNPPNPTNITDGDLTTDSGTGIKSFAGVNGDIGYIIFNMGASYPVFVEQWTNFHRASGNGQALITVQFSDDGITWKGYGAGVGAFSADIYRTQPAWFGVGQYFRIYFWTSGVTTNPSVFHVVTSEVLALQKV